MNVYAYMERANRIVGERLKVNLERLSQLLLPPSPASMIHPEVATGSFLDSIADLVNDPDRPNGVPPAQWAELKPRKRLPVTPHDKPFARCIFAGDEELAPVWMAYRFFGGHTVFGYGYNLDQALVSLKAACEWKPVEIVFGADGKLECVR